MDEKKPTVIVVALITAPAGEPARSLARGIVQNGLAACVNRIPAIESFFMWKDKLEVDTEDLLIVKTDVDRVDNLKKHVSEAHPYDTPELIVFDITDGLPGYLKWVIETR
ncbi:divalent cation tolerance protein CutA [bacterium]|nr:divalent cation tolerance protein CutA [bacterium]